MAESSWPDPSSGRTVTDREYELLSARFSDDGIDGPFFNDAPVTAGTGMQVLVKAGWNANVRGYQWESGETDVPLTISANASGSTRTDWVALRLDRSDWRVRAVVREGSPGAGPPSLVQQTGDTGFYEIPLATVRVTSGAGSIVDADVTPNALYIGSRIRPSGGGVGRNPRPMPGELAWLGGRTYENYDGTSWQTILENTGWVSLSPANEANWSDHVCRAMRLNGVVYCQINVRREGSDLVTNSSDAAQGSHLVTLPEGMRPSLPTAYPTTLTAGISGRLRVYSDGRVFLQAPSHTVGIGRFLRHAFDFPLG